MKKAILVISFGTTYRSTLQSCIEGIENQIRTQFPDYEVRRAFTSRFIIKKLAERDGISVEDTAAALSRLKQDGFSLVAIQPTHVIAGFEFEEVKAVVETFRDKFVKLVLGRPLLYFDGSHGTPDDYAAAVAALRSQLPPAALGQAVVLMGHGTSHRANQAYDLLEARLRQAGLNVYLASLEHGPTIEDSIVTLEKQDIRRVTLMPFMLVAGDHALRDMAGDAADTWQSKLQRAGFAVDVYLKGLGENPAYQQLYIDHLRDALRELC